MSVSLPLIIHFHIPRTGGTTVGRMLKMRLGFWPPSRLLHHHAALGFYRVDGWENRIARIEQLSESAKRRVRLFEAHAGFGLHELLPQPSAYVTMLRETIDRAASAFYYMRRKGVVARAETIESFLARSDGAGFSADSALRIWRLDNAYVRFFAGERGRVIDLPASAITRTMLEVAIERLEHRIDFVGLMEQFDASMVLLGRTLPLGDCFYIPSKANAERKRVDELPHATLDLLRERNVFDLELHARAAALFKRRITAQGPSFDEARRRFVEGNLRYATRMGMLDRLVKARRGWIARRRGLGRSE